MITAYIDSEQFFDEAKYILQFFFTALGWSKVRFISKLEDSSPVLVYYGSRRINVPENIFLVQIADAGYYGKPTNPALHRAVKRIQSAKPLPSKVNYLYFEKLGSLENVWYEDNENNLTAVSCNMKTLYCAIDIIATSFYMLSLENERRTSNRDELGRFLKKYSEIDPAIYDDPMVDQFLLLFDTFLKEASRTPNNFSLPSIWPQNHNFALALSHDVDRLRTWTVSKIRRALREGSRNDSRKKYSHKLFALVRSVSLPENWSGNFEYITKLENKYGGNSTFFFVSKPTVRPDPRYKLSWKRILEGLSIIGEQRCHVGLHGTISASTNSSYLKEEKTLLEASLGKPVKGLRQHYLRFNGDKTLNAIANAGFEYDSTLGFANAVGYRCGTTLPFHPFNTKEKRPYPFLEIPLILMDTVLMLETKLHMTSDEAWEIVEKHLELAYRCGFCLTVNWHNNNINIADVFGYGKLYEKMLAWAQERNAWICSLDDLYDWWIKKIDASTPEVI